MVDKLDGWGSAKGTMKLMVMMVMMMEEEDDGNPCKTEGKLENTLN